MKSFIGVATIKGEEKKLTIQEIGVTHKDGTDSYLIHSEGLMLAIVSVDGNCSFEVIDGKYTLKELEPVCNQIRQFKKDKEN